MEHPAARTPRTAKPTRAAAQRSAARRGRLQTPVREVTAAVSVAPGVHEQDRAPLATNPYLRAATCRTTCSGNRGRRGKIVAGNDRTSPGGTDEPTHGHAPARGPARAATARSHRAGRACTRPGTPRANQGVGRCPGSRCPGCPTCPGCPGCPGHGHPCGHSCAQPPPRRRCARPLLRPRPPPRPPLRRALPPPPLPPRPRRSPGQIPARPPPRALRRPTGCRRTKGGTAGSSSRS